MSPSSQPLVVFPILVQHLLAPVDLKTWQNIPTPNHKTYVHIALNIINEYQHDLFCIYVCNILSASDAKWNVDLAVFVGTVPLYQHLNNTGCHPSKYWQQEQDINCPSSEGQSCCVKRCHTHWGITPTGLISTSVQIVFTCDILPHSTAQIDVVECK